MSESSSARAARHEIVVRVDTPVELLAVDRSRLLTGPGRLVPGMDELIDRFLAQKKVRRRQRIVIELAAPPDGAASALRIDDAIRRYCELRVAELRRQRAVMWRQGTGSLFAGFTLFFVGVVLSYGFTRPETPDFWRQFLGDGVFLVVAWIGLWFPFDLLFIARQPLKREMRIVAAVARLPVTVRVSPAPPAEPAPPPPEPTPPPAGQSPAPPEQQHAQPEPPV